ncbi:MAG: hypothetical protein JKY56_02205 [Kofleriaceae bacterium]|nr:hypothetical protein [Kofleriaceae bacterium]
MAKAHIIEVRDRVVCFSCTQCGGHFSHLVAQTWDESIPKPDSSIDACPKCGQQDRDSESACSQCGLSRENYSSYKSSEISGDGSVATGWASLQKAWHSDDAHRAFTNSLVESGDFRGGAAKYREAAKTESKRIRCEEMLDSIQKMASVALLTSKPKVSDEKEPFGGVMLMLVACFVLAGASVLYAMMRDDESGAAPKRNSEVNRDVSGPRLRSLPLPKSPRQSSPGRTTSPGRTSPGTPSPRQR